MPFAPRSWAWSTWSLRQRREFVNSQDENASVVPVPKEDIHMLFKFVSAFVVTAMIAVGALVVMSVPVSAIVIPQLCDFTTGGGFVFADTGAKTTFGSHGGCKHKAFWGHVNYVDHGGRLNTV